MITAKERGLAPFQKKKLDRFPMWYGGHPETTRNIAAYLGAKDEQEALYDILGIDYVTFRPEYMGKPLPVYPDGSVETVFGIRRGGYYYGQALNNPLKDVESFEDLKKTGYRFPSPDEWNCRISAGDAAKGKDYCVIGGAWSPFFHDVSELFGMEQMMILMYTEPDLVKYVTEQVFAFYYELTKRAFEENPGVIDFLFIGNDFGSQRALLMSPSHWEEFFGVHIRKMADLAHSHGAVAGLHSCGDIHQIIPRLIEMGIDAINPIQVNAEHMDPAVLKREYGGDVVFFGGIDETQVLLHGTEAQVREETKRILDILGSDGMYIVAPSHDYLLPEVPACNIVAMYEEAKKYR